MENVPANFVLFLGFARLFVSHRRTRTGQTDGKTDGRTLNAAYTKTATTQERHVQLIFSPMCSE